MTSTDTNKVAAGGVFRLDGETPVHRLGFGAMRITGEGIWGPPADHDGALAVLRRAVELGIDFIDTADSYGPYVSEELIAEALHPYPEGLVIATKGGLVRTGPGEWHPVGDPKYLRQEAEMSLRRLKLDRIPLYQLHRPDPKVPIEDSDGELAALRDEGKIQHVGVSNVTVEELARARAVTTVATVQNRYNLTDRASEDVLDVCTADGLGFIPWFPIAVGELARPGGPLDGMSTRHGSSPGQLALAWLLRRSPAMLPIPGTSSVAHLEENVAAAAIELTDDEYARLEQAV
jgi:pyridoxine 4-dehydrogenase